MKVTLILRKTVKRYDVDTKATIYVRLRDGRSIDMVAPTKLSINPNLWDDKSEQIKSKVVFDDEMRVSFNEEVRKVKSFIEKSYHENEDDVNKNWLKNLLDKYYHPEKYIPVEEIKEITKPYFVNLFDEFLLKHKLSEVRKKNFRVVGRAVRRYELYVQTTKRGKKDFFLDIDEVTPDTLRDIWNFLENEYKYVELYPQIYKSIPEKRTPQRRSKNTLLDCFARLRTFFIWCYDNDKTQNKPFERFPLEESTYGTPFYITLEERDKIFNTDFSATPQLEIQRDIFIFQSLIGCRVGDLYKMTKDNVIDGAIEYVPRKTKEGNPITVRVPLNEKAQFILEKYKDEKNRLFPFISEQKYNVSIKKIFRIAEINRIVTILDPLTNEGVRKPLHEVASSHLARRTFIGNIYKNVKDPNLVGALSGHKEGSKAFNRYRQIDEDMKKELVNLLN